MPPDDVAAIPADVEFYWPFYMGVQNPTGGLYSSSSDLSRWLRYVLGTYNAQALAVGNWFSPTSFSGSVDSFYGAPWEIFRARTKEVVGGEEGSTRPLTFVSKGGGLPGYSSVVVMVPEYGIGVSILVAGNGKALGGIREVVVREVVRFAEEAAMVELRGRYEGVYEDERSNSSITFAQSELYGLTVTRWVSNGVDTLRGFGEVYEGGVWVMHVLPTLLFEIENKQEGERWRLLPQKVGSSEQEDGSIWDNFCISDWDTMAYAGKPVNEIVFWGGEHGGSAESVSLSGFRSTMFRKQGDDYGKLLVSQQPVLQKDFGS